MPNKEGGYGGYRWQDRRSAARKVRAPGAEGGVRRGVQPPPSGATCPVRPRTPLTSTWFHKERILP